MPMLHRQLVKWQTKLTNQPWDKTLIKMAMMRSRLGTSTIFLETDVQPSEMMDVDFVCKWNLASLTARLS